MALKPWVAVNLPEPPVQDTIPEGSWVLLHTGTWGVWAPAGVCVGHEVDVRSKSGRVTRVIVERIICTGPIVSKCAVVEPGQRLSGRSGIARDIMVHPKRRQRDV